MTDRNYAVDFIKTVAIIAVISIHISTAFLDRSIPFSANFNFLLLMNQFSRFAVPLFFASSGFLLALKYNTSFSFKQFYIFSSERKKIHNSQPLESNAWEFYKKRLVRILPSYLFWTLIYYLVIFPHSFSSLFSVKFLNTFLAGSASYQLYFVPAIFVLYLSFPFFIKWKSFFLSRYFLFSFFIISSIYLYFVYLSGFIPPLFPALRNALYNTLPFLLGIYTAINFKQVFSIAKKYSVFIFLGLGTTGLLIFTESYILFKEFLFDRFLREQWRPSVQVYALFCGIAFTWFYEKFLLNKNREILFLSKYSFGVFFIHVAVLELFLEIVDMNKWFGLLSFTLVLLGTISLSYTAIWVISKIPKVGKTISAA